MGCTESKPEAAVVPAPAKSAPPQVPTASKPAVVAEAPKVIPTLKTEEQAPKSSQAGVSPGGAAESVALPSEINLTELCSKLSTDLFGKCTSIEGIVVNAPPTSSADAASWYNTAIWPEQTGSTDAPMTDDNVLYSAVARPAEEVVICTIKGSGTTLSDGQVTLGDNAALVFDSSCSNVSLKNLTVIGGVIVCYGEGCSVTLTNCELQACTVMCLAGACVNLKQTTVEYGSSLLPEEDEEEGEAVAEGEEDVDEEDCDEEEMFQFEPAQAVGLFVSGPGSKMCMQDGMVQGCTQGIAVQDNAQFFGSCSRTEEHPRVMIRDTKNAVEVCTGALFDFQDLHVQGADGSCVHVHSSARADLKSCIAGDAATGYALRSGAALSLFRCDINSTCIAGVALSGGATADLKECWVHESNDGDGIYVHGSGSKVTATLCCINDNASHAVLAENSGVAVLTKCFVGDMPTSDDEGEAEAREEPLCHETDGGSIEQSDMVEAMAEDLGPPAWIHTHPEWEVDGIWAFQKQ